jgi:xanthine/uracil permease
MTMLSRQPAGTTLPKPKGGAASAIFDIGFNERLPVGQSLILGLQNVFGMTGMFVFPGLLGRAFNLSPEQIAYLYGMSFATCGIITILQSVLLLRLPIIQGPYAGNFAALMAVGHLQSGGLGAAYGSLAVAALIWCVLTVPIRGFSIVGLFAGYLRAPIISGMIVILTIVQIANVALPSWIGLPASPGFGWVNFGAGTIAVAVLIAVTVWGGKIWRRGAVLFALAIGSGFYALFRPVSFAQVASAPLLVTPRLFPFGFGVQPDLVAIFLLVLIAAGMGSMAMYQLVADWGGEKLSPARSSEGVLGVGLGTVLVGIVGGFSTIVYPDNIGLMRTTRVGSRYATMTAGILLIVLGGCVKFDMLLVVVPTPVLSASATLLFGIVFMQGVQMLGRVNWDDRAFIAAGLAIMVGIGGLFVPPDALAQMPLWLRLLVQQPVISGGLTVVILYALLGREKPAKES